MFKAEAEKWAVGALVALALSIVGIYASRETKLREELSASKVQTADVAAKLTLVEEENARLKMSATKATATTKRSRVEVRADGSRVEELEESAQMMEQLLVETQRHYQSKLETLWAENQELRQQVEKLSVKTVTVAFKPWALAVGWQGRSKGTGSTDLEAGYHLPLAGLDLGLHAGTPVAGPDALLPLDSRPYRLSVHTRF